MDALIGSTGFVGQNLSREHCFDREYNSANVNEARFEAFDLVVCAAAPGSMFEANRRPDRDWEKLSALQVSLEKINCRRFVLVSTVAVLGDFGVGANETSTAFQEDVAYGRNRRKLEEFCEVTFANCTIVRLPALFGKGLKKNFLFDLSNPLPTYLSESRLAEILATAPGILSQEMRSLYDFDPSLNLFHVDRNKLKRSGARPALEQLMISEGFCATTLTNPDSTFQYYYLARLWADIKRVLSAELRVVHFATEPLRAGSIHKALLGTEMPVGDAKIHYEDLRTNHGELWGQRGGYIYQAPEILSSIKDFYDAQQSNL